MNECEQFLGKNLCSFNPARILSLAFELNLPNLISQAIEHINRFPFEVMTTDDWKALVEQNAELMNMLYKDLLRKYTLSENKYSTPMANKSTGADQFA